MPELHEQSDLQDEHASTPAVQRPGDAEHDHGADLASTLGNAYVGQVLRTPGVQRAGATSAQQLDESVARAIEQRRGGGQPLDDDTRAEMEGSLGHDLSDVRVHTDSDAHQLNEAVSARAFTTGNDVFFKQGTYDAGSSSGRELLGHELTHVVQQRTGTSGLQPGEVSDPSDAAEQHAEAVGQSVAGHDTGPTAPAGGVARQAEPEAEEEEPEEGVALSPEPGAPIAREADEELEEETT